MGKRISPGSTAFTSSTAWAGAITLAGGLIYASLKDLDPQASIEFAVAASCLKRVHRAGSTVSVEEVLALAGGNAGARAALRWGGNAEDGGL